MTTSKAHDISLTSIPTSARNPSPHSSSRSTLPLAAVLIITIGLFLLARGYWGAWLPHYAAGLNILGIDLPEYIKFVPEVTSGQIPIKREIFFYPLLSVVIGLLLLATIQRPRLPLWFRGILLILAVPASLAMLPPAWTPALLRTPEFRMQTLAIAFLLLAVILSPFIHRYLPDSVRGVIFILAGIIPFLAISAYNRLLPALEKLYTHPTQPGTAYYLVAIGAVFVGLGGVLLLISQLRQRSHSTA